MIVEKTYPIVIDGKFHGIAGVERSLQRHHLVHGANQEQTVRRHLTNQQIGSVHLDDNPQKDHLITKDVKNTIYTDVFEAFLKDSKTPAFEMATDPAEGEKYYYPAAPIPTGAWTASSAGWRPTWPRRSARI